MEAFRGGKSVILAAARAASTIAFSTRTLYKTRVPIARGNILLLFVLLLSLAGADPTAWRRHEKVEGEHPPTQ